MYVNVWVNSMFNVWYGTDGWMGTPRTDTGKWMMRRCATPVVRAGERIRR